jgi:hypothetical protein
MGDASEKKWYNYNIMVENQVENTELHCAKFKVALWFLFNVNKTD